MDLHDCENTENIQKQKFMWKNQSQKLGSNPTQVIFGQILCSGPIRIVSSTNNFITKLDKSYLGGALSMGGKEYNPHSLWKAN